MSESDTSETCESETCESSTSYKNICDGCGDDDVSHEMVPCAGDCNNAPNVNLCEDCSKECKKCGYWYCCDDLFGGGCINSHDCHDSSKKSAKEIK